jgi:hypothetical protein
VTVSCRLWYGAAAVAVAVVVLTVLRLDVVRDELGRVARDSDPAATADTVGRVVDLSVLVIVGGGLVLGVAGGLCAVGLRAGRRWARPTLTLVAVLAVAYGVLVLAATGWLVLVQAALALAAAVLMYLPVSTRWLA